MLKITVNTQKKREVVDITDSVNEQLGKQGVKDGVCNLFLTHTTAALTTADLDPGTDQDYLEAFGDIIPKLNYNHPHNPSHMPDHILSSLVCTSLSIPVEKGQLILGIWQRVVLLEFDGPKQRELLMNLVQSS